MDDTYAPSRPQHPPLSISVSPVERVKRFLTKLPDEQEWRALWTKDQVQELRKKLTCGLPRGQHTTMSPYELLQALSRDCADLFIYDKESRFEKERQICCMVYLAIGTAAIESGKQTYQVDRLMAEHMKLPEASVRNMRLGVRRWLSVSTALQSAWLPRADELPLYRKTMINLMKYFGEKEIDILRKMKVEGNYSILKNEAGDEIFRVYVPPNEPDIPVLSVSEIIHGLLGKTPWLESPSSGASRDNVAKDDTKLNSSRRPPTSHNMMNGMNRHNI